MGTIVDEIEGLQPIPEGTMDAFMEEREYQLRGRLPEQVRIDDEGRGWKYNTDVPEGDARKFVTLVQDRMMWVGIRAWNYQGRYWMNNSEPETATVIAWADLPDPATGHWQNGKLFDEERPTQEIEHGD